MTDYHWTPALERSFVEGLAETGSVTEACRGVSMSRRAAYDRRRRGGGLAFRVGWDAAVLLSRDVVADAAVIVSSRVAEDALWLGLKTRRGEWSGAGIASVKVIGDAEAPAPIAWATYAGRRYAEELDAPDPGDALPFRREIVALLE